MEIEGEDGTKLILKPGDKAVFGRGAGFTTDDLTVSRRHVSLELKPFAGGGTESGRVSFEVLGRNPVWVRKREPGEKIRTFRKSETGEIAAGDRFCVSGQLPNWFTLKRRDEATEERASGSESGLDCIDGDPVKGNHFFALHHPSSSNFDLILILGSGGSHWSLLFSVLFCCVCLNSELVYVCQSSGSSFLKTTLLIVLMSIYWCLHCFL